MNSGGDRPPPDGAGTDGTDGTAAPRELDVVRAALREEYDQLEELGRGGMAVVYRARERQLDREVALKVLPIALTFDADFVERFQREARTAAALEHPGIIPIYRVGKSGAVIYFAMKLLRGQSLSQLLRTTGPLSPGETRRILTETAAALGHAASRGVVHRDVKPDNIMLEPDGRCIVTDFGIARSGSDPRLTATGMSLGTPRYMSPEQARSRPLDGRSDLYSLGIVGYECLTGRPPFDGDDALSILLDHLQTPLPRPALVSRAEHALFGIIERLLAKAPEDRFQTSDELVLALRALDLPGGVSVASGSAGSAASDTGATRPIPHPPQRAPALNRALAAAMELLRQQGPRLDAGLKLLTPRRAAAEGGGPHGTASPVVDDALAAASAWRVRARARTDTREVGLTAATAATIRGRLWGARRIVATLAVGSLLVAGAGYGVHRVTTHRSRCPAMATPDLSARGLTVLLDAPAVVRQGAPVQVYYDVCGLARGARFTARLSVVRQERGLRGQLGRTESLRSGVVASARGTATRRHETLNARGMPAGSYMLYLTVSDAMGRRREREAPLVIR